MSEGEFSPCSGCYFNEREFPCRKDGKLNKRHVAECYLVQYRSKFGANPDAQAAEANWWAWECLHELSEASPEIALEIMLIAVSLAQDENELGYLAAGPLEDVIAWNGEIVIEAIEMEAWYDPDFRKVLWGVWSQGNDDTEVWQRVLRAREGKRPDWLTKRASKRQRGPKRSDDTA